MNRQIVVLIVVLITFMFFTGCVPKEAVSQKPEAVASFNAVYDLVTQLPTDDSRTEFKTGDVRLVYGEKLLFLNETAEASTANGASIEYVKISNEEGDEMWIPSKWFIPNGQLGVVVGLDSVVYNSPKTIDPSTDIINKGTLVVISPEEADGFTQFVAWDEVADKPYSGKYLKSEDISVKETDVNAARFLFLASTFTGENAKIQKKELLNAAYETKSGAFMQAIRTELSLLDEGSSSKSEKPAPAVELPVRTTESFDFAGIINDDNVNVRDYPYETGTNVLTQLNIGSVVSIDERTVEEYTVGGATAAWYHLVEADGWVFGSFIDAQ